MPRCFEPSEIAHDADNFSAYSQLSDSASFPAPVVLRFVAIPAHQVQSQGDAAFLHTESDNPAKGMY